MCPHQCPRLPGCVREICLRLPGCVLKMSATAWVCPQNVRGCLGPSSLLFPDFHSNRLEFCNSDFAMTLYDPPGVSVLNFIEFCRETAEKIADKGKKCPRLPGCVLSRFKYRIVVCQGSRVSSKLTPRAAD